MADTGDCSICLQNLLHPAQLPCGHIFCFLCIKGCALHKRRCPMCRVRFSARFFDDPKLLKSLNPIGSTDSQERNNHNCVGATRSTSLSVPKAKSDSSSSHYVWFYEGFGGWWQYDERTSREIEESYMNQLLVCEVTVAGYVYTIDLINMTQFRKDQSGRRRRIKRDLSSCEKKGIAGIKLNHVQSVQPSSEDHRPGTEPNNLSPAEMHPTCSDQLEQSSSNAVSCDVVNQRSPTCLSRDIQSRSRVSQRQQQQRNSPNPRPDNSQPPRFISSSQSDPDLPVLHLPRSNNNNRRTCRSLTRQV